MSLLHTNIDLLSKPTRSASPTFEPVTLAEAKKHVELAEEYTHHDSHLVDLIQLAREQVEHDTGIVCCTGTFIWKLSQFPDYQLQHQQTKSPASWVTIPLRPVTSITSITYVDDAGSTQTWSSTNYGLKTDLPQPIIYLGYDKTWPTHRGFINDITVTLVAGYATQGSVPQLLKQMCLLAIARDFYDRNGLERHDQDVNSYVRSYEMLLRRVQRCNYP